MSHIILHPTKGVNPRLTQCPACGGVSDELVLLGKYDSKFTCDHCKRVSYGASQCLDPNCRSLHGTRAPIGEHERLPGGLCSECRKKREAVDAMVAAGGAYFRCVRCGSEGALKPEVPMVQALRAKMGVAPPEPIGVNLEMCPYCHDAEDGPAPEPMR